MRLFQRSTRGMVPRDCWKRTLTVAALESICAFDARAEAFCDPRAVSPEDTLTSRNHAIDAGREAAIARTGREEIECDLPGIYVSSIFEQAVERDVRTAGWLQSRPVRTT